ncbi:MAG: PIN domain-containing protein [Proteobacteria bacterium]|nr:PIN domain-containing protein [Pseudomonadota bacterium]
MSKEGFLIDTSIWIKYLRGMDSSIKEYMVKLIREDKAYTSDIVIMEILQGAKSEKEYTVLYNDFTVLPKLALDTEVWELAWKIAYRLRKEGINVPLVDTMISALALANESILVHSDSHFDNIAGATGLKVLRL